MSEKREECSQMFPGEWKAKYAFKAKVRQLIKGDLSNWYVESDKKRWGFAHYILPLVNFSYWDYIV